MDCYSHISFFPNKHIIIKYYINIENMHDNILNKMRKILIGNLTMIQNNKSTSIKQTLINNIKFIDKCKKLILLNIHKFCLINLSLKKIQIANLNKNDNSSDYKFNISYNITVYDILQLLKNQKIIINLVHKKDQFIKYDKTMEQYKNKPNILKALGYIK